MMNDDLGISEGPAFYLSLSFPLLMLSGRMGVEVMCVGRDASDSAYLLMV